MKKIVDMPQPADSADIVERQRERHEVSGSGCPDGAYCKRHVHGLGYDRGKVMVCFGSDEANEKAGILRTRTGDPMMFSEIECSRETWDKLVASNPDIEHASDHRILDRSTQRELSQEDYRDLVVKSYIE
jgi:hypothetical protein